MLIYLKPTTTSGLTFQSDIGQYNVLKKHLQLWYNSARPTLDGNVTIKEFKMPEDVKTIELIDLHKDERLKVPVKEFKKLYKKDIGYVFKAEKLRKKYFRPS